MILKNILSLDGNNISIENWRVYGLDGKKLMFVTGKKKVDWYLRKKLAKVIDKNAIRLTFEPKGSGYDKDDIFGLTERKPICVVTGQDIRKSNGEFGLQKHHVVPYCYRKWFPEEYKSKNHHDVLLVTDEVHRNYEIHATMLKDDIADRYQIKTIGELNGEYTKLITAFSSDSVKILSSLSGLFISYNFLSREKIINTLNFISDVSGIKREILYNLNLIQLYKLYSLISSEYNCNLIKLKKQNKCEYDHGYQIVSKLDTHEKISEFVKLWRQHFVDTMNPKYLPEGWSIDYKIKVELN